MNIYSILDKRSNVNSVHSITDFKQNYIYFPKYHGSEINFYQGKCYYINTEINSNIFNELINIKAILDLSFFTSIQCILVNNNEELFNESDMNTTIYKSLFIVSFGNLEIIKNIYLNETTCQIKELLQYIIKYEDKPDFVLNDLNSIYYYYNELYKNKLDGIYIYNLETCKLSEYSPTVDNYLVTVKDIIWECGFNNILFPKIIFDDYIIHENKRYLKCTGYTYNKMKQMKIGIGAIIKVEINNFPIIKECIINSLNMNLPINLEYEISNSNLIYIGKCNTYYSNSIYKFYKYFSNFKISNVGKKTIERFVKEDLYYIYDIFNPDNKSKIMTIKNMSELLYTNIVTNIINILQSGIELHDIILSSPYFNNLKRCILIYFINYKFIYFDREERILHINTSLTNNSNSFLLIKKDLNDFNKWLAQFMNIININIL